MEERYNNLRKEVRSAEKRLRDISQIRSAAKTVRELQPVKDGWFKKNFKSAKDRYAEAHADELKQYNSAYRLLKKLCGRIDVDLGALVAEYQSLESKVSDKAEDLEIMKSDLKELRTIRYYVGQVLPEEPAPDDVSVQVQLSEGRLRNSVSKQRKQAEKQRQKEPSVEESKTKRR